MAAIYTNTIQLMMNKPYLVRNVPATFHASMSLVNDDDGNLIEPPYSPEIWETYDTRLPIFILVNMFKCLVDFEWGYIRDMFEVYGHLSDYLEWLKSFPKIPVDHESFYEDCTH